MDDQFVQTLIDPIRESLAFIDLVVFVSINKKHPIQIEDDGIRLNDPTYRSEVDDYLKEI
ncbi:hypothetical protein [Legionella antarctica]|nr:hypothetical protein [Legionella antarctica]